MTKRNRDDFTEKTKLQIAKRAGWLCSFPTCRASTVGATSDGKGEISIGTAAHICAAAPGGPRYDGNMSQEERSSPRNGMWMCRDHGYAIDSADPEFTVELLHEWKRQAEFESRQRVLRNEPITGPTINVDAILVERIRAAAKLDLEVFRRTTKWPSTSVPLTLQINGLDEPVMTSVLASVVTSLNDLILVAPPGMGKTTTLFQIAESVLSNGTPLLLLLGDWATESVPILDSILNRPAFRGISEDDFRTSAAQSGVVMLLDGWNELSPEARARARVQVSTLQAELPELGFVVSTRRQALDVPFEGTPVDLLPLNEKQQMQIAAAMRGDAGEKIVDQAWRTAGLRELVAIPLYLTSLLALPKNAPFPKTKEEVLRHFVMTHEKEPRSSEVLRATLQGFQQHYLEGLALVATQRANTAIFEDDARRSISETETLLADNEQIAARPQPSAVLDVLVSDHVLICAGDAVSYSFQHQQFQEWYASHSVERRIIAGVANPKARESLKAEIFDLPAWEEAILFAVERLARGDAFQHAACGKAILAAFEVDPILAAEMIYRSTEEVWAQIATSIQGLVSCWHVPGEVDRAVRFMLISGRPEFLDTVWPLISHEDNQISLNALRNCKRFRPSILGNAAESKIRTLPANIRRRMLYEIASNGGLDGLDLATKVAMDDADPEMKASVIDALSFRRADRHIIEALHDADDRLFDLVANRDLVEDIDNEHITKGIAAARMRQVAQGTSMYERLRAIVYRQNGEDRSAELADIISSMEIDSGQDASVHLIYEASKHYPESVAGGLIERICSDQKLFYGADDILASTGVTLENEKLLQLVLENPIRHDNRADAAASVLGPQLAGSLIDAALDMGSRLRADERNDPVASETYSALQERIRKIPGASLVAAVVAHSAQADNGRMADLSNLLSRHPQNNTDHHRPFDADSLASIRRLVEDWGNRMLNSGDAKRWQTAGVAMVASCAPSASLLPILKLLLDDNLSRFRQAREEAQATGWRQSEAANEAGQPTTHEYQRAFIAIKAPETAAMMQEYLMDEHFGVLAAQVLADQWRTTNEPPKERFFGGGVDFSHVAEKRTEREADPDATSVEANAIFTAIESLINESATQEQKRLAVGLGMVAARLPHGRHDSTIEKLFTIAPRRARADLLLNLVLSGESIDIKYVSDGVAETLEAAETDTWILTQNEGYELKAWLRLLPFVNQPAEALTVIRSLRPAQRKPQFLEDVVTAFADSPSGEAEDFLFKLAEEENEFYLNHDWRRTALRLNTKSSGRRIIDLTSNGAFDDEKRDAWHFSRELGSLIEADPDLRTYVYQLLKDGPTTPGLTMLARAIAENPDEEGLLLLITFEMDLKRSFVDRLTIEKVITVHVPYENEQGVYSIVPTPSVELRRKLLTMATNCDASDRAAHWLTQIDRVRDEYGMPETEPRHPDLSSGKPWPNLTPLSAKD